MKPSSLFFCVSVSVCVSVCVRFLSSLEEEEEEEHATSWSDIRYQERTNI